MMAFISASMSADDLPLSSDSNKCSAVGAVGAFFCSSSYCGSVTTGRSFNDNVLSSVGYCSSGRNLRVLRKLREEVLRLVLFRHIGETGGESGVPGNLGEEAPEDSAVDGVPSEVPTVRVLPICLTFGGTSEIPAGALFFCWMCRSAGREAVTNCHLGETRAASGVAENLGEESAEDSALDGVAICLTFGVGSSLPAVPTRSEVPTVLLLAKCLPFGVTSALPAALFFASGCWSVAAAAACHFLLIANADICALLVRRGVMTC
mmetsp:Transcript_49565/g.86369  ORF Transcript_49565/g.86369 Transcript_49565/m.86369 type:complete len:263 (+) Transcript_49565:523-1311(+)